jgi:hypothetical protein
VEYVVTGYTNNIGHIGGDYYVDRGYVLNMNTGMNSTLLYDSGFLNGINKGQTQDPYGRVYTATLTRNTLWYDTMTIYDSSVNHVTGIVYLIVQRCCQTRLSGIYSYDPVHSVSLFTNIFQLVQSEQCKFSHTWDGLSFMACPQSLQ